MYNPFDLTVAPVFRTGVTLLVVDRKCVLEVSQLSIGLPIISKRRAASFYRLAQDIPDKRYKAGDTILSDVARLSCWMNPCTEQHLADINVSQTTYDTLIKKGRFDRHVPALQSFDKIVRIK